MRPAFVLVAPEEAGVVAVQAPVGAVRRAGRQVAVAGREGRSHREAVAEVRVHAYRASPGGELVAAFIPAGVEFGVGARAFHPHVEAGEVVVDVGRVDAHEGGPVPDPAHLVAQGVPLCRPKRVDRAPSRRRHGAGGSGEVAVIDHGADAVHELGQLGVGVQVFAGFPEQAGSGGGVPRVGRGGEEVFLPECGIEQDVVSVAAQCGVLVVDGEEAGYPGGEALPVFQAADAAGSAHQDDVMEVAPRVHGGVSFHVGEEEAGSVLHGDGARRQHGGAKGGVLVEVVDQFRRGAVLEGDVFHVERGVGAALGVPGGFNTQGAVVSGGDAVVVQRGGVRGAFQDQDASVTDGEVVVLIAGLQVLGGLPGDVQGAAACQRAGEGSGGGCRRGDGEAASVHGQGAASGEAADGAGFRSGEGQRAVGGD